MPRRRLPSSSRVARELAAVGILLLAGLSGGAASSPQALLPKPPLSLTVANKSLPSSSLLNLKPRGWLPPNKNTTLSALQRSAVLLSNASDPAAKAQEAAALARGLALHGAETKALLLGKTSGGILTLEDQVPNSSSNSASGTGGDLVCLVDRGTGQLVGLSQGGALACSPPSAATTAVVVPTASSSSVVSQIKLGYSYDGLFVSRLVFYLRPVVAAANGSAASASAAAAPFICGSAGGKAVDLLPSGGAGYAVTKLAVGCAPLPAAAAGGAGRRRLQRKRTLLQTPAPPLGLSAGGFGVAAAPLAAVLASPQGTGLGQILAPADEAPSPAAPSTPTPTPSPTATPSPTSSPTATPSPTPPPAPVTVSPGNASLAFNATTLVISGSGFDAANPQANVVTLSRGLSPGGAVVTAATATTLTLSLVSPPTSSGPLTAVVTVTSRGVTSGAPVQVATLLLPLLNWRGAGASGDGTKLFLAVNGGGNVWRSVDGGASFAPTVTPAASWQSVSADATGTFVAAVAYNGSLYLSRDGGATFAAQTGGGTLPASPANWNAVTVSSDGSTVVAAVGGGGGVWVSRDAGTTFSLAAGGSIPTAANWRSVAVSADGSKMAAVAQSGNIWLSQDGGGCWTAQSGGAPAPAFWRYVSMSADGSALAAVVNGGAIWVSRDAGGTWAQAGPTAPTAATWSGCALSADGSRLAATLNGGNIWLSANGGVTSTAGQSGGAPTAVDWYSIAGSASGQKLIAGIYLGHVWLSGNYGATWEMR